MAHPSTPTDVKRLIADLEDRLRLVNEQRREQRYPLHQLISLGEHTPDSGFEPHHPAWCIDLSVGGMGMLLDKPLAPGQCLHASLRLEDLSPVILPVEVVFCRRMWSVVFRAGCQIQSAV